MERLSNIPVNMALHYPASLGVKLLAKGLLILCFWVALAVWDTVKFTIRYVLPVVLFLAFAGGVAYLFVELVVALSWAIA